MDGRGRWIDNVFIERLWHRPHGNTRTSTQRLRRQAAKARAGIGEWLAFYNHRRPHQALANRTPMAVWREGVTGVLDDTAVDMTLRLDNAHALPTCPQPQQQQVLVA